MSRLIDADRLLGRCKFYSLPNGDTAVPIIDIENAPTVHPVIVPCDYAKSCNEVTMNKVTSAVAYFDVLEELRKHGYVLVDMREVKT